VKTSGQVFVAFGANIAYKVCCIVTRYWMSNKLQPPTVQILLTSYPFGFCSLRAFVAFACWNQDTQTTLWKLF